MRYGIINKKKAPFERSFFFTIHRAISRMVDRTVIL